VILRKTTPQQSPQSVGRRTARGVIAEPAVSIRARDPGLVTNRVSPRKKEAPIIVPRVTVLIAVGQVLTPFDEAERFADRGVVRAGACDPQSSDREERRGKVGVNLTPRLQDRAALGRRLD